MPGFKGEVRDKRYFPVEGHAVCWYGGLGIVATTTLNASVEWPGGQVIGRGTHDKGFLLRYTGGRTDLAGLQMQGSPESEAAGGEVFAILRALGVEPTPQAVYDFCICNATGPGGLTRRDFEGILGFPDPEGRDFPKGSRENRWLVLEPTRAPGDAWEFGGQFFMNVAGLPPGEHVDQNAPPWRGVETPPAPPIETPPISPPPPSIGSGLSPLVPAAQRAEELRKIGLQVLRDINMPAWLFVVAHNVLTVAWDFGNKDAVASWLIVWRRARRKLGDPRPLPPGEE